MHHPPPSTVSDKSVTTIQVSGYVIEREIGRGGMATVYLALQESLQRHVALKVIASNLKGDPDFTKRFLREGQLIAKLTDPRIITVFDIGIDKDVYYLAMEYLPGGTLRDRIQAGLSLEDTLQIVRTVAGALGYAHRCGIVHRDIKPQNIMFHENGDPVLSDFGIAKAIGGNTVMTMSGMYFGTPRYMSPEQIKGQTVDGRSDLYSLGILFYEMLTGELPYSSDDSFALAFKHVTEPIPNLPSKLVIFQPLLNRLLAKDPEDRFPGAEQFLKELRELEVQHLLTPTVTETTILPSPKFSRTKRPPKRRHPYWKATTFGTLLLIFTVTSLYFFAPSHWVAQLWKSDRLRETVSEKQPDVVQEELPDASVFLTQARQFFASGALDESLKTIAQGLNAYPEDSELLALRERVRNRLEQQLSEANAREQEAERLLERAQRYRQQGNYEAALMDIEEGLKIVSQHAGLLNLRTQVLQQQRQDERQQSQQERQQKADRLLSQAQQSKGTNDLSASENYINEGLRLVPNHAGLLALQAEIEQEKQGVIDEQRLEQTQRLLEQARQLQRQKQFEASLETLEKGLEILPNHRQLLALQDQVSTQLEKQSQIKTLLEECADHFRADRLTIGPGGNALDCYNKVLDLDPGNMEALAGLENMAERYANWAEQALRNGSFQEASAYLDRLIQVNPEFPRLNRLQRRLAVLQTENPPGPELSGFPFDNAQEDFSNLPSPAIGETEAEAFWNAIKDSQDIADFDQFLVLFGDHPSYGLAARLKRERLRREQTQSTAASESALLTIDTNVPNAQVWIDGKDYGSTGQKIVLPPGTYNLSVEKEGYEEWRGQVELIAGSDETLTATINPLPPAETQASAQTPSSQGAAPEGRTGDGSAPDFGCIEGNCTNGTGTYLFKNGDKFSGQWKDSKIFNRGTYFYKNGEKYVGEFENGKINGTGTYYYNSGNRYEGTWKDGIKSGTGTHYYAARGEKYVGEFKDNEPHGQGTYYYSSGDRYEGEWQNGRKHGEGKYYRRNGESYTGIWENNRKVKVISFN